MSKRTLAKTFKEPFLRKVKEALANAVSISWDGCHKIYIAMDDATHEQQIDFGYSPVMVVDKSKALKQLFEWFDKSCGLRFINSIENGSQFYDVISQFEYDDENED